MPGIGEVGQARLAAAHVVVLGAGGLGFPVLSYLAAAGVGSVTVIDHDVVEPSNLNRQCLFGEADVGRGKAERACERLLALNSSVRWGAVAERLTGESAARLLDGAALALDCADNFPVRLALAQAAWRAGIPVVHGAVAGFEGTLAVFRPPGPCLGCLYRDGAATASPPVLGAVAGVVGSLMAGEAIRLLCGLEPACDGRVLLLDLARGSFDWIGVERAGSCPVCR